MNPNDPQPQPPQPSYQQPYEQPQPKNQNPLNAMQEGEQVLFDIRRHPIGLLGVYVTFGFILALVGACALLVPNLLPDVDRSTITNISLAVFMVVAVFSLLFIFIAHIVYYGNRWILTSDSLTQIQQTSLFSKQNAQLALDNLEDVTAEQNGILTHIFNYGVLKTQTAGEHGKFQFNYCRNPNEYAQKILMAREQFEHGNMYNQNQPHANP